MVCHSLQCHHCLFISVFEWGLMKPSWVMYVYCIFNIILTFYVWIINVNQLHLWTHNSHIFLSMSWCRPINRVARSNLNCLSLLPKSSVSLHLWFWFQSTEDLLFAFCWSNDMPALHASFFCRIASRYVERYVHIHIT